MKKEEEELAKELEKIGALCMGWHYFCLEMIEEKMGADKAANFYISTAIPRLQQLLEKAHLDKEINLKLLYWKNKWKSPT